MTTIRTSSLLLLALASSAAGCVARADPPEARFATGESSPMPTAVADDAGQKNDAPAPPAAERRETLGQSVEGRPIECLIFGDAAHDAAGAGDGAAAAPETVLFIASIHGDEPAGTPLMEVLATRLREQPELLAGRRVVIIPVANPDGLAAGKRHNSRGVDLNRNFPADNRREDGGRLGEAPLSEPEALALSAAFARYRPARVISFHQPASCVDYDGPGALAWAKRFSVASDLAVHKIGARQGSVGAYFGETMQVPVITVELPSTRSGPLRDADAEKLWDVYGRAVLAMIAPPVE